MVNIDWIKYLVYGAGAAVVPVLASQFASEWLVKIPMWGQDLWGGLTLGGIVLAGAGVLLVDQLVYKK